MRFLPFEDQVIVDRALALGLNDAVPPPAYLSPHLCTVLSFLLAVPTLGFSIVLVPILWVAPSTTEPKTESSACRSSWRTIPIVFSSVTESLGWIEQIR